MEACIPLTFQITKDNRINPSAMSKTLYKREEYDLSKLARQMVFYSSFSEVCSADYIATSEGINHILEPRITTCSDFCHVIGKHYIGMTHLFYKFKIIVGDKEYWSDVIKITYAKSTSSTAVTVGIRVV